MECKKITPVIRAKCENVYEMKTAELSNRSQEQNCNSKHLDENLKLTNIYRKNSKDKISFKSDGKVKVNSNSKEFYSNYNHKMLENQNSNEISEEIILNMYDSHETNIENVEANEMNDTCVSKLRSTLKKSKLNERQNSKTAIIYTKKVNSSRKNTLNDCEYSEPSTKSAKNRFSAYFQSLMPKHIAETPEAGVKTRNMQSNSKLKKGSNPVIVNSFYKDYRRMTINAQDSKIALRVKYIKWLHDEKKFFNLGAMDEKDFPQFSNSQIDLSQKDYALEPTKNISSKKRKPKDQRKKTKKPCKQIIVAKKISNVSQKIESKNVSLYGNNIVLENKNFLRMHHNVRVFTSAENARKIKSNKCIKRTFSLNAINMTKSASKSEIISLFHTDHEQSLSNNNDIKYSIHSHSNVILVTSKEKQTNIKLNDLVLDFSQSDYDYFRNELDKDATQPSKESEESVRVHEKINTILYNLNDIRNESQIKSYSTESEQYNTYDDHLREFQKFYMCPDHYNNENQYAQLLLQNCTLKNPENYNQNQNIKNVSDMKHNLLQKHNKTTSTYRSGYYLDSAQANINKKKYNFNFQGLQKNIPDESNTEHLQVNENNMKYMNKYQNEELNSINKMVPSNDKINPTKNAKIFDENIIKQANYYQFNFVKSNKKCNGNDNESDQNYTNEYNPEADFKTSFHKYIQRDNGSELKYGTILKNDGKSKEKENLFPYSLTAYDTVKFNTNIFKSEKSVIKSNSHNDFFNYTQYSVDKENNKSRYQSDINCKISNFKDKNIDAENNLSLTAEECNHNLCNTLNVSQKVGRKRKFEQKDNETEEDVCNENGSESVICKSSDGLSHHKTEQSTNDILGVMSELQEKVSVLQDQISTMNTSCNKFENIETLLVLLKNDVSHGLKQVESKLKNITTNCMRDNDDEIEKSVDISSNDSKLNTLKKKSNSNNSHDDAKVSENEDDNYLNQNGVFLGECETENSNANFQSKDCRDIGLMTDVSSPTLPCETCDKNEQTKEMMVTCIFDKGIQCRINELQHHKTEEVMQSPLLAVEETSVVRGLASDDKTTSDIALRKANYMIGDNENIKIDERQINVKANKTIINQQAFDEIPEQGKPHTMSPEAFKKSVERDANERAENRRMRKGVADGLMKRGNKCFREKEYEKALALYSKAISEVADSCLLYTNRALTCLHLRLYKRVISDCDMALKLNDKSMKAMLYKARALFWLSEDDDANKIVEEVLSKHPEHSDYIKDYISRWNEEL